MEGESYHYLAPIGAAAACRQGSYITLALALFRGFKSHRRSFPIIEGNFQGLLRASQRP